MFGAADDCCIIVMCDIFQLFCCGPTVDWIYDMQKDTDLHLGRRAFHRGKSVAHRGKEWIFGWGDEHRHTQRWQMSTKDSAIKIEAIRPFQNLCFSFAGYTAPSIHDPVHCRDADTCGFGDLF